MIINLLLTIIAISLGVLFFWERHRKSELQKYFMKINALFNEEINSPPLYTYEKIRKKLKELESKVLEADREKKNVLTILNNITDPIFIINGDGVITFANIAAREITRPGVEGRKVYEVVENYHILEMFEKALQTGEPQHSEVEMNLINETRYYGAKIISVRFEEQNERYILVMHDKTKERLLDKVRRDFISNVSHELRTPLTSIHGYAEALLYDDLSNQEIVKKFLGIIESESARMTRLINELLDLEKLESGEAKFTFGPVDMCEVLERVRNILEPLSENYKVKMYFDCQNESEIEGDFDRLVQLTLNLVDNAVKYTSIKEIGEKKVFARVIEDDENVILEVEDTGPGIPEDAQQRIFERFFRVDKARTRRVGGTGLGLSIVKMIAEKHNAKIEFESKVGEGTKFRVIFKKGAKLE